MAEPPVHVCPWFCIGLSVLMSVCHFKKNLQLLCAKRLKQSYLVSKIWSIITAVAQNFGTRIIFTLVDKIWKVEDNLGFLNLGAVV